MQENARAIARAARLLNGTKSLSPFTQSAISPTIHHERRRAAQSARISVKAAIPALIVSRSYRSTRITRPSRPHLLSLMLRPLHHLTLLRQLGNTTALRICLTLRFQRGRILRQLLDIRQKLRLSRNILPENLWNFNAVFLLVILEDAAEGALGGAEGAVEGVAVVLCIGGVGLLLLSISVKHVNEMFVYGRDDERGITGSPALWFDSLCSSSKTPTPCTLLEMETMPRDRTSCSRRCSALRKRLPRLGKGC